MSKKNKTTEMRSPESEKAAPTPSRESTTFPPMGPGYFSMSTVSLSQINLRSPVLSVGFFSDIADGSREE